MFLICSVSVGFFFPGNFLMEMYTYCLVSWVSSLPWVFLLILSGGHFLHGLQGLGPEIQRQTQRRMVTPSYDQWLSLWHRYTVCSLPSPKCPQLLPDQYFDQLSEVQLFL